MNLQQTNELNMYEGIEQILTTNNAVWSGNPAMVSAVATYTGLVSAINANSTVQLTSSKGTTQNKQNAKLDMLLAAVAIANAGKAFATDTTNTVLYDAMNFSKDDFTKAKDTVVDDMCQAIHDNIAPYIALTVAYGADSTSLTNLQNFINTYSTMLGQTVAKKVIVSNATLTLVQKFSAVNALFKKLLDPLVQQYKTSSTIFYNQYTAGREVINTGHRHTVTLSGFIYNSSNNALANATVVLSGGASHTKITNANGQYKFTRLHIGTYTLTVSIAGYTTQAHNLTVTANGTLHTDFIMVGDGGVGTGIGVGTV